LGVLVMQLMRSGKSDPFVLSAKAIVIGFVAQCLLNSVLLGVLGFMVWTFASMSVAQMDFAEESADEPEQQPAEAEEYMAA
jgi:hypothetical protein